MVLLQQHEGLFSESLAVKTVKMQKLSFCWSIPTTARRAGSNTSNQKINNS